MTTRKFKIFETLENFRKLYEAAEDGMEQAPAQAPQDIHASVILYAIFISSPFYISSSNFFLTILTVIILVIIKDTRKLAKPIPAIDQPLNGSS